MVTGLVYTEVHGSTNQRREVFRVKRALTTKARKISRMHVGTSGNQTAYANKPGRTLLRSIQKMQTDILTLQKNGDDQNDEILTLQKNGDDQKDEILTLQKNVDDQKDEILILQKNGDDQKNKILTLQKKVDSQDSEIMILRPLKDTAIDIRKRFFATYRRRVDEMEAEDKPTIDDGNLRAHAGDVCLDVSLFKNHFIECEDTFSTLYGLSWLEAQSLFGMQSISFRPSFFLLQSRKTQIHNLLK